MNTLWYLLTVHKCYFLYLFIDGTGHRWARYPHGYFTCVLVYMFIVYTCVCLYIYFIYVFVYMSVVYVHVSVILIYSNIASLYNLLFRSCKAGRR